MILVIGEILFDQFPDYRKLGGTPFNFAFHLVQFGLPVRFISRVGADQPGEEIFNFLRATIGQRQAPEQFIDHLFERYSIELIALTRGGEGSELFLPQAHYTVESPKAPRLVDTVGAGDAYAAMLAIGHMQKWHPKDILDTATEFACKICEIEGAIPQSKNFYSMFMESKDFN